MRIIGIDPGSRITGFGVLERNGNRLKHIENGSLFCDLSASFAERLVFLFQELQRVVRDFRPEVLAIEKIFYGKNAQSLEKLGEARGVLIASAALTGIPVFEYTALQVKKAVTGYGGAAKNQVQQMVMRLMNLRDVAEENASDALAVAICHAHATTSLNASRPVARTRSGRSTDAQELLKKASFYR